MTLQLIGIREAARCLGLAVQTLYNMVSQGRIPSVRLGRRRLFDLRELERFVQECSAREREWPPTPLGRPRQRRKAPGPGGPKP